MKTFLFIGFVLQLFALPTLCAFAWFRGGVTERRVATALMVAVLATIAGPLVGSKFQGPNWGVIVVDIALMIALVVIARQSKRFWPIWAAASQLGGCLAHLPVILNPGLPKHLYGVIQPFWIWPVMTSLLIGTISAHRERWVWERLGHMTPGLGRSSRASRPGQIPAQDRIPGPSIV